ncbi:hypothetical protein QEN19_001438 [Hanseniaspora menglaensis]
MAITNLFTPKHQRLVLQCYPKGKKNFEKQPKSSELSYLLYYCNSRRTKLTKVSTFLGKKVAKDIKSKKFGDVYVTIIILCKIIINCKENLGIFFDDFISIIFNVLSENVFKKDEYILEGIVQFFESLALNFDQGFISNTQINEFHKFLEIYFRDLLPSEIVNMDSLQQQKLLRACVVLPNIKSIKHLEFFREFLFEAVYKTLKIYQVNNSKLCVKVISEEKSVQKNLNEINIKNYEPRLSIYIEGSEDRLSRRLTHVRSESGINRVSIDRSYKDESNGIMPIGLDDMDPNDALDIIERLSLETLKEFFSSPESDLLPLSIKALNLVMVELPNIHYYKFVISGIPVQLRYIAILITVNGIVNANSNSSTIASFYSDHTKSSTLLNLMSELMLSEVSIVALSVVDIVKKLIDLQISLATASDSSSFDFDDLMKQIPYAISIMNTRNFYKDQLSDILHEILNLIENYADQENNKQVMSILYGDMSFIIDYLDKASNQINLSLFNDVTMILRDNLKRSNYEKLFEITLNSKNLNNQTCLTFFESLRQLNLLYDMKLTGKILSLALKTFKSNILLGGLTFYKIVKAEGEPVGEDYFVYHLKAAQFLNIKDYENKVQAVMRDNRYFDTTELLNYYSDETLNPYSIKGSNILSDCIDQNNSITTDAEAQAKEDELIYNMMNTSLQSLGIPKTSSFSRHVDVKSLSGLQTNGNGAEKPSVNELKSLLGNNAKNDASGKLKRKESLAAQSVKSKVTNITFLLSELQDSSKNLKIRMPNEDQVSQLDERIIKQNKLNRNSFTKGKGSFNRLSNNLSNSKRLSKINSNNSVGGSAAQLKKNTNNLETVKKEDEEDDDEFNFVDASSDVSSIGELDNRGNLFI